MKKSVVSIIAVIVTIATIQTTKADTISLWNFDSLTLSSSNTNSSPNGLLNNISADFGSGTASGVHATGANGQYSTPVGNGSVKSISANNWSIGDYYQFSLSTVGFTSISLSFSQISSSTGPGSFTLQYSSNGTSYTTFGSPYSVIVNASPNTWGSSSNNLASSYTFDLSSISALANNSTVSFRLVDFSTNTPSGGAVATTGTDRVDSFTVSGVSSVPEPTTIALATFGGVACFVAFRRRN